MPKKTVKKATEHTTKKAVRKTTGKAVTVKKTGAGKVSKPVVVGKPIAIGLSFGNVVDSVTRLHTKFLQQATKAVNVSLTLRNWLIGAYIHEYELRGADRASYGDNILVAFAETLTAQGVPGCDNSSLYKYLRFYRFYPQISETLSPELQHLEIQGVIAHPISETLSPKSQESTQSDDDIPRFSGREIMEKLSYSHISLLLAIDDPYRRAFYEMECMRGGWSYRELKRQIGSLYFERTALSTNKPKLREIIGRRAEIEEPKLIVRDPMVFEFLGLKPSEVMLEEDVERRMLDKLQELLLELGHGFCFESRQKRILIDGEYFFVDLVFYHRILRCHVLFDLKITGFKPDYMGQLHTYVNWYRENIMTEHDQPPIGILLCTGKSEALVKYATAGLDNQLFVSRYLAELPTKEELLRITRDE
jgi:predicted nuclease of restriction endonuclease-like (RecB) superfamily